MESRHKSKSKRWFFKCFKHNDVVASPCEKDKTSDPLLTYIAVAEKQGIVLPTILSSAWTAAKGGGAGEDSASRRKKIGKDHHRLGICQALMAALNHTSLGKILNRSKTKKDTWSRSRTSKLEEEVDNISISEHKINHGTNSNTSSSRCSPTRTPPSSLSSFTYSSGSQSTHALGSSSELHQCPPNGNGVKKQKKDVGERRKGCFVSNMAMCLHFLTSLLALILWGKFCAILCTSIGFFVIHRLWKKY